MTTSFAWFARGNIAASLYVQPMGTALALLCSAAVWAGGYVAFTGRAAHQILEMLPARWWLGPLLALGVLAWAWKIFLHLHHLDGWR
jgi:hypothetical protein